MPSVAQETPSSQSCKKRRRDDQDEGRGHTDIQPSLPFHQNVSNNINTEETFDHGPLFHQLPLSMRITMPMKRQRTYEKDEEATRPESISSHTFQKRQSRSPTTGINRLGMNRCHICSRKPTKKNELDQYADCQGCGQRACFKKLQTTQEKTTRMHTMVSNSDKITNLSLHQAG
ncbi:hypothetical protein B0H63DRAFT_527289 [Podospora didyma]|uniref:Uncharacterized protein n=1 Tax=Podospora didyma TaxID=330526 RepID=A0AAE0N6C5_9PEZI|nr:hypothetical protein B0H63DRAFT_527289 [Podospora didyma]